MPDETRPTDVLDQPTEREAAFGEWSASAPSTFSGDSDRAIRDARAAPEDAQAATWRPLGPRNVGGAIRALVQDGRDPATFYAGAPYGGVWKTDNEGFRWWPLGGPALQLPVGAVALAPSNSRVLWVGTGLIASAGSLAGQGLFRSENAGDSFDRVIGPAPGGDGAADEFSRIVVDPREPHRAWAATDTGLWRFEPDGSVVREGRDGSGAMLFNGNPITDVALVQNPADSNQYLLLAGESGDQPGVGAGGAGGGVFRGVYDRSANETEWFATAGGPAKATGNFARVRVAFGSDGPQPTAYAIVDDQGIAGSNGWPSGLWQSTDGGRTWNGPGAPPFAPSGGGWAWWPLCLAVDPRNPQVVVVGYVDVQITTTGGTGPGGGWRANPLMLWTNGGIGERAQHGDQHEILFDVRGDQPNRLWIANDGGVSMTPDYTVAPTAPSVAPNQAVWRKRSYGLVVPQLTDLTSHPTFPYIHGGGMQDNGTYVSYGGPTWYAIGGGDGGQLAFHQSDPRRMFPTSQNNVTNVSMVGGAGPVPGGTPAWCFGGVRRQVTLPDVAPPNNVFIPCQWFGQDFTAGGTGHHIGVVEADRDAGVNIVAGRQNGGFYSVDGQSYTPLNIPGAATGVTAATFAEGATDVWFGTTDGRVFHRAAPPAPPLGASVGGWTARPLPGAPGRIAGIAVHPANANVVAVSTMGMPGQVFLTHDAGGNWRDITGTTRPLPRGPYPSVAWDPANTQVLFAATLAGVYVVRNLPARAAGSGVVPAVDPEWSTFSRGLPLVLVNNVHVTPITRTLRCATHARGSFECTIGSTPANRRIPPVRLSVRVHVTDDSYTYAAANTLFDDPRLRIPAAPAAAHDQTRGYDVRIDAPSFHRSEAFRFGDVIDGVEFDEQLVSDRALVGDTNWVYVQVHNRGHDRADNVRVHLYWAPTDAAGDPPGIQADKLNYPDAPTPDSPWQRADEPQDVGFIEPGHPAVVRFGWLPPVTVPHRVALLAVASNAADELAAIPTMPVDAFTLGERRAALRVSDIDRDTVFIRDGVDGDGRKGAVAWGGRSPDIIVRRVADLAAGFDPVAAFPDLGDAHREDRVRTGNHRVFVRVHNRTASDIAVDVRLFQVPVDAPSPGTGWTRIGPADTRVNPVPARGWAFAAIDWNGVADPGGGPGSGYVLMALARTVDPGTSRVLDPYPEPADVTDLENFWEFFTRAPVASNAAMRAVRFEAGP